MWTSPLTCLPFLKFVGKKLAEYVGGGGVKIINKKWRQESFD